MRIAIIGSGALGLYYGALLQRSGEDVRFLLRRDYDAITMNGLSVHSINGDFHLSQVAGYRSSTDIGQVDLVLVGLKTFANDQLPELIAPLLGASTQILTLQNGLGNEELLAHHCGAERIVGGVAFLCSNRGEPGVVHHLGAGRITIGDFIPTQPQRCHELADCFTRAGIDCRITNDLKRARWEKLVWNIPFNGLCTLLQQSVDQLLVRPASRLLVRHLMIEVITAANAQPLGQPIPESYADAMLEFTDAMGVYRPSMQIDRESGRQLELESIFRIPLRYGSEQSVPMPRVAMLTTLLEQVTE